MGGCQGKKHPFPLPSSCPLGFLRDPSKKSLKIHAFGSGESSSSLSLRLTVTYSSEPQMGT